MFRAPFDERDCSFDRGWSAQDTGAKILGILTWITPDEIVGTEHVKIAMQATER